jgi:hypothetical protein
MSKAGTAASMVRVEMELSPHRLAELRQLGRKLGRSSREVMQRMARNVATSAMRETQPYGVSNAVRDVGHKATLSGVWSALSIDENSTVSVSEALLHHRSVRDSGGKVPRGSAKLHVRTDVREEVVRKKQARVGLAKAAWGQAALNLGAPRIPKWIGRHNNRWTRVKEGRRLFNPTYEVTSRVSYASEQFTPDRQLRVVRTAMFNVLRNMQREIDKAAGIFNRRQRR